MNEFNNRIEAQRQILRVVNRYGWAKEELFGLSAKAIERWVSVNRIDQSATLVKLVLDASSKLFFLANKSQEQVSPEYQAASREVDSIAKAIELELTSLCV
jgi:hypothetical protein